MAFKDERLGGLFEAGLLDGDQLGEMAAAHRERLEGLGVVIREGLHGIAHHQSEARDEAGVQPVDGAVKFNFLPMHGNAALLDGAPPELLKHKTGASVFRFTEIDEHLATALEAVVARGFLGYMGDKSDG